MAEQEFRPGDNVPRAGIYLVIHEAHRDHHEAVVLQGGVFPNCRECGERVRYRLSQAAASLDDDSDFDSGGHAEKKS